MKQHTEAIFSEHKVDDIAKSIDGIKQLLQGLNVVSNENYHDPPSYKSPEQADSGRLLIGKVGEEPVYISRSQSIYDHSAHIISFVKDIVEAGASGDTGPGSDEVIASLRTLVQTVEGPTVVRPLTCPDKEAGLCQADVSMPPLQAVVAVLRWAKGLLCTRIGNCDPSDQRHRARRVLPTRLDLAHTPSRDVR